MADIDLRFLTPAQGFRILSETPFDSAGRSVSNAGDVNGDGIDDIIVGANYNDAGGTYAGAAYVIYGRAGGFSEVDLTNLSETDGFRIIGDAAFDYAGNSVSNAGDVNGDGVDDLIVGANRNDSGGYDAGAAYVVYGRSGGRANLDLTTLTAADGFRILGDAPYDYAGRIVSSAGDVNGDGIDDVIVGARYNDSGGTNAGAAYVVYGRSGGRANLDLTTLTAADGFRIIGDAAYDEAGRSVSNAGDVNGDGIADLIVGAYGNDAGGPQAGAAYVIYGRSGGLSDLDLTTLTAADGFRIIGDAGFDFAGRSVSNAGDVNGDGVDDLIVGADGNDAGGNYAGAAYVIYGRNGGRTNLDLTNLTATDGFRIIGDAAGDRTGFSVSNAGDVNGDGIDDLIVGAPFNETYVVFGRSGERSNFDLTQLLPTDGVRLLLDRNSSVSAAGDVNGDGIDDLIVGAYGNDAGDTVAAYVVYGRRDIGGIAITSNGGESTVQINLPENTAFVTTVTSVSPTGSIVYSLGSAQNIFTINPTTGELRFTNPPNFEALGGSRSFSVIVQASNGTSTDSQEIIVTIQDFNEFSPVIVTNDGGAFAIISVIENFNDIATVTATDNDIFQPLRYSISGGDDAEFFSINAQTGEVSSRGGIDFDARADANNDNLYEVRVRATDTGGLFDEQLLLVSVNDVNDLLLVGDRLRLNTSTFGHQSRPAAATLSTGDYVVAWQEIVSGPAPISNIRLQRFDSNGQKLGGELFANPSDGPLIFYRDAEVTALSNGRFIVSWEETPPNAAFDQIDVKAQIFDSVGNRVGNAFLIDTDTSGAQSNQDFASLLNNRFVALWQDRGVAKLQIFENDGVRVGEELALDLGRTPSEPAIESLTSGRFIVTWLDYSSNESVIHAQIFTSTGDKFGSEIVLRDPHTTFNTGRSDIEVTGLTNGNFVISWTELVEGGSIAQAQLFSSSGSLIGQAITPDPEAVLDFFASTSSSSFDPEIAPLANGEFAIVYNGLDGVYASSYSASGQLNRVNTSVSPNDQVTAYRAATITSGANNEIFVAFEGYSGILSDGFDVFAQRLTLVQPGGNVVDDSLGVGSDAALDDVLISALKDIQLINDDVLAEFEAVRSYSSSEILSFDGNSYAYSVSSPALEFGQQYQIA